MEANFLSRFENRLSDWKSRMDSEPSNKDHHEQEMADYILQCMPFINRYVEEEEKDVETSNNNTFGFTETKGLQKGDIFDDYLESVEGVTVDKKRPVKRNYVDSCDECAKSNVVFFQDSSELVCDCCGKVLAAGVVEEFTYKDEMEITSRIVQYSYKRINHFNEYISAFQGQEQTNLPDEVLDKLRAELKKMRIDSFEQISHSKIRALLKKNRLNKYYEHVHYIGLQLCGMKPPRMSQELEERLRLMFRDVQPAFEKVCPSNRKNFLSYSYCIYKMLQILGEDEFLPYLPLLKSREKLLQADRIWEGICGILRWEFIPTAAV